MRVEYTKGRSIRSILFILQKGTGRGIACPVLYRLMERVGAHGKEKGCLPMTLHLTFIHINTLFLLTSYSHYRMRY